MVPKPPRGADGGAVREVGVAPGTNDGLLDGVAVVVVRENRGRDQWLLLLVRVQNPEPALRVPGGHGSENFAAESCSFLTASGLETAAGSATHWRGGVAA